MNEHEDETLKTATDVMYLNNLAEEYARSQFNIIKKIIEDLHLIKRKMGINE
jgi:hypothetical protein